MDLKNIIAAIALSAAVIVLYGLFFAPTQKNIDESELKHLGIFSDKQETIKIIEWPQLIDIPLSDKLEIHLDYAKNEDQREIKFIGSGKWRILDEL